MSATSRHAGGGSQHGAELVLLWSAIAVIGVGGGLVTAAVHLAAKLDDSRQALPANPFTLLFGLGDGSVKWSSSATTVLIAFGGFLIALAVIGGVLYARRSRGRSRVDRAANRQARRRDAQAPGGFARLALAERCDVAAAAHAAGRAIDARAPATTPCVEHAAGRGERDQDDRERNQDRRRRARPLHAAVAEAEQQREVAELGDDGPDRVRGRPDRARRDRRRALRTA